MPLWVSTKVRVPLGPTFTMCAALGVGVAPGGGVNIGVGVAPGGGLDIGVGVTLSPGWVGDDLLLQ